MEKLNRVKLVEKEKDDLEPAMRAALGFIRLENDKVEKQHRQRLRYILDAEFRVVMVNLGGELIETTGTMTGGGRSKISGKMGQQSSPP